MTVHRVTSIPALARRMDELQAELEDVRTSVPVLPDDMARAADLERIRDDLANVVAPLARKEDLVKVARSVPVLPTGLVRVGDLDSIHIAVRRLQEDMQETRRWLEDIGLTWQGFEKKILARLANSETYMRGEIAQQDERITAIRDQVSEIPDELVTVSDISCLRGAIAELGEQAAATAESIPTLPEPVDLSPVQARVDEIESMVLKLADTVSSLPGPVDLSPVDARFNEIKMHVEDVRSQIPVLPEDLVTVVDMPEPVDLSPLYSRIEEIAEKVGSITTTISEIIGGNE